MKKIFLALLIIPCIAQAMDQAGEGSNKVVKPYILNDYDYALWDAINKHDHPKVLATIDRANTNFVWPEYGLTPPMRAVKELRSENRFKMASTVGWDIGIGLARCLMSQLGEAYPVVKTVEPLVGNSRTVALLMSSQQSEHIVGSTKGLLWDLLRHEKTDLNVQSKKNEAIPKCRKPLLEMTVIEQIASMEHSWNPYTVHDGKELRLGLIKLQCEKLGKKQGNDLPLIPLMLPGYGKSSGGHSGGTHIGSGSSSRSSGDVCDLDEKNEEIVVIMSEIQSADDMLNLDEVGLYRIHGIHDDGTYTREELRVAIQEDEFDFILFSLKDRIALYSNALDQKLNGLGNDSKAKEAVKKIKDFRHLTLHPRIERGESRMQK